MTAYIGQKTVYIVNGLSNHFSQMREFEQMDSVVATRLDSISSDCDYLLASYQSLSMDVSVAVEADDCVAFDYDDAAKQQIPSWVERLIVNLRMMRME